MVNTPNQADTGEGNSLFNFRLNPRERQLLRQLAESQGRSQSNLIKFWINREATKAKIQPPEETKNAATQ